MIFERAVTEKMYDFYKSTHLSHLGVRSESRVCRFSIRFFAQILQKNGEYLDI